MSKPTEHAVTLQLTERELRTLQCAIEEKREKLYQHSRILNVKLDPNRYPEVVAEHKDLSRVTKQLTEALRHISEGTEP